MRGDLCGGLVSAPLSPAAAEPWINPDTSKLSEIFMSSSMRINKTLGLQDSKLGAINNSTKENERNSVEHAVKRKARFTDLDASVETHASSDTFKSMDSLIDGFAHVSPASL